MRATHVCRKQCTRFANRTSNRTATGIGARLDGSLGRDRLNNNRVGVGQNFILDGTVGTGHHRLALALDHLASQPAVRNRGDEGRRTIEKLRVSHSFQAQTDALGRRFNDLHFMRGQQPKENPWEWRGRRRRKAIRTSWNVTDVETLVPIYVPTAALL